jgi:hypothetical protein
MPHVLPHAPFLGIALQYPPSQSVACLRLRLTIARTALDWVRAAQETTQNVWAEETAAFAADLEADGNDTVDVGTGGDADLAEKVAEKKIADLSTGAAIACRGVIRGVERMDVFQTDSHVGMFENPTTASINNVTQTLISAEDAVLAHCDCISGEIERKEEIIQKHLQKIRDEMENIHTV